MQEPRFHLAVQLMVIFLIAASIAGCREEAKPAATAPAETSPSAAFEPPDADGISSAVQKAVESAKSGGSATYVSGPDGTVAASFAMPGVENVNIGISTESKAGKSAASITVTFSNAEPLLLTPAAFAALKTGMDYTQVGQAIGGEMTKGKLGDQFTGTFAVVQAGRRFELSFKDGKVDGKKSKGIE